MLVSTLFALYLIGIIYFYEKSYNSDYPITIKYLFSLLVWPLIAIYVNYIVLFNKDELVRLLRKIKDNDK